MYDGVTGTLDVTTPPPVVYLDMGPLCDLAQNPGHAERLQTRISRGGTVVFMRPTLAELAGLTEGPTLDAVAALLDGLGAHFAFADHDPWRAARREAARALEPQDAALDEEALRELHTVTRFPRGTIDASWLLRVVRDARARWIDEKRVAAAENLPALTRASSMPRQGRPPHVLTPGSAIERCRVELLQRVHVAMPEFDENDNMDLFHAMVPLAICDFLLLDKHWAGLAAQVPAPPRRAQVFSGKKGQIPAFLDALEAWTPAPEVK